MPEYTLIIRDILAGNKEIIADSIVLSGLYEQHPKDFFESKTVAGLANRENLRKKLQEKLHRSAISSDILEYIIAEWCQGIQDYYKKRFILSLEIPYTQSTENNTPQHTEIPVPKIVDRKRASIPSPVKNQNVDKPPLQPVQETETQIISRAADDKLSLD